MDDGVQVTIYCNQYIRYKYLPPFNIIYLFSSMALIFLLAMALVFASVLSKPLDDYVWKADPNYGWVELPDSNIHGPKLGWTGYMLNMTSQQWLTDADFAPSSSNFYIAFIYQNY